jgi:hypothetical protein
MPNDMKYLNDQPAGLRKVKEGIVEVKIWEAFLLYNRHNIYSTLTTYSIDETNSTRSRDLSIVTFRFSSYDWINTLKKLLMQNNIPVISEETHLIENVGI